jgi:hypothetical protein
MAAMIFLTIPGILRPKTGFTDGGWLSTCALSYPFFPSVLALRRHLRQRVKSTS